MWVSIKIRFCGGVWRRTFDFQNLNFRFGFELWAAQPIRIDGQKRVWRSIRFKIVAEFFFPAAVISTEINFPENGCAASIVQSGEWRCEQFECKCRKRRRRRNEKQYAWTARFAANHLNQFDALYAKCNQQHRHRHRVPCHSGGSVCATHHRLEQVRLIYSLHKKNVDHNCSVRCRRRSRQSNIGVGLSIATKTPTLALDCPSEPNQT